MLALEKYLEKVREGDGDMKDVVEGMVGKLGLGFVEGELERLLEEKESLSNRIKGFKL